MNNRLIGLVPSHWRPNKVSKEFAGNNSPHGKIIASFHNLLLLHLASHQNNSSSSRASPARGNDDAHSPYSESGLLSCFRPISHRDLHFFTPQLLKKTTATTEGFCIGFETATDDSKNPHTLVHTEPCRASSGHGN